MIPSKKELEILLSKIKSFESPKPELEQYITPSSIASDILWQAFMDGFIKYQKVADFGSGTGIFAIGSSLLGAELVVGYETDANAIKIAKENVKIAKQSKFDIGKITFEKLNIDEVKKSYDTILMNPPFGVQKKHADKIFLEKAFRIAKKAIYSIHKAGPQNDKFIENFAHEHGFLATKIMEKEMPLKATMEFHEKEQYLVTVAVWRFIML